MINGEVKGITAGVCNRRMRIIYLVPIFLAAMAISFLLQLSTYEAINSAETRLAFARYPQEFEKFPSRKKREFRNDLNGLNPQKENATRIVKVNTTDKILQFWEEPNLLNLNNFTWLKNNEHICDKASTGPQDLRIMPVLVHTSRSNFQERLAIRRTLGSLPIYQKWDIRFVFLIGEADRGDKPERNRDLWKKQEEELNQEQHLYGDLVEGSFTDSYHNNTYKHLMGYKWVLNFCHEAEFVLRIDDDIFVDLIHFLDWRTEELYKLEANTSVIIPELYCHMLTNKNPYRENGSKWYASVEDWPDESYPDYCLNWAYFITVNLIQKIYSVSNNIKFFWIDDVFVTGALLEVAKKVYNYKPEIRSFLAEAPDQIANYRPFCESQKWDEKMKLKAVGNVPRGDFFEWYMMCMWNKILHDGNHTISPIRQTK